MIESERMERINQLTRLYVQLDYILLKGIESDSDIRIQIASTEASMDWFDVQTAATIAAWQNR